MGLNFGGGSSQSTNSTSSSGTNSNLYSSGQTNLQDLLTSTFSGMIPSMAAGTLSPDVQAQETGAADTINKTSSSLGDRMTKFLAARGFGQSGRSGQVQLQNELGRESALGANASSAASTQLGLNSSYLTQALAAAYAAMGSTKSDYSSGSTSGSNSNWGANASAAFSF